MTLYRVVCADPPWQHNDQLPGPARGASSHYSTMSAAEIRSFRVPMCDDDALLFLWRVASMVEEAYSVVRAWHFEPKSEIVWEKVTKTGKAHFGMGHIVRASHETCIVATRGRYSSLIKSRSIRSRFSAAVPTNESGRAIHSAKPEFFYTNIVQELVPGPYVELFARRQRLGWTCLGKQAA